MLYKLAESQDKLQSGLCKFKKYSKKWKLNVNVRKIKVVIFPQKNQNRQLNFKLIDENIK